MRYQQHSPEPLYFYKKPLSLDETLRKLKRKQKKRQINSSLAVIAGTTATLASVSIVQALNKPPEEPNGVDEAKTTCNVMASDTSSSVPKHSSTLNFVLTNVSSPELLNTVYSTRRKIDSFPQSSVHPDLRVTPKLEPPLSSTRVPEVTQELLLLERELIKTRKHLRELQTLMGLDEIEVQASITLVQQLPQYQNRLTEWQNGERQRLIKSKKSNLPSLETDSLAPSLQDQQLLLDQMHEVVLELSEGSLITMNPIIRDMILGDLIRYDYLKDWLTVIHQLQVLERSYQTQLTVQELIIAEG